MKSKFIKIIIAGCMVLSLLILSVPSNVYANVLPTEYQFINDYKKDILSYKHYLITEAVGSSGDKLYEIYATDGTFIKRWGDGAVASYGSNNEYVDIHMWRYNNGAWANVDLVKPAFKYAGDMVYSNCTIYEQDRSGTDLIPSDKLVFQNTPLLGFHPIMSGMVTQEAGEPITITILGLIKLLIPLLVGWLALRKALAMLSQILRQA